MKKIMKNFVCMFLCVIMAVSIIQIPEKVTGETTESFILYRYMDAKTEKYGYVNKNGKVIVKAVYNEASEFSNGFAQVRKNGKSGFINSKGELAIPLKYESVSEFSDGLAAVSTKKEFFFITENGEPAFDTTCICNKK